MSLEHFHLDLVLRKGSYDVFASYSLLALEVFKLTLSDNARFLSDRRLIEIVAENALL